MNPVVTLSSSMEGLAPAVLGWGVSVVLVVLMSGRALRQVAGQGLPAFHADESGAAYSLSYVMAFPFYVILVILIVETTLLFLVRIGVVYAAYAGARAGIVHESQGNRPADEKPARRKDTRAVQRHIQDAAVNAMAPFASGSQAHRALASNLVNPATFKYVAALGAAKRGGRPGKLHVARKHSYAAGNTSVRWKLLEPGTRDEPWTSDIAVIVSYRFPFNVAYAGWLLGARRERGVWVVDLSAKAVLQNESPKNKDGTLGIEY